MFKLTDNISTDSEQGLEVFNTAEGSEFPYWNPVEEKWEH